MTSIIESVRSRDIINHIANTDKLTGINNTESIYKHITNSLKKPTANKQCLITFDIDGFKHINELHGKDIGDELLKNVVKRNLKENLYYLRPRALHGYL